MTHGTPWDTFSHGTAFPSIFAPLEYHGWIHTMEISNPMVSPFPWPTLYLQYVYVRSLAPASLLGWTTWCRGELFALHPKLLQDFMPDKIIKSYEQLLKLCRRLQRTDITVSHGKLFPTGSFSMGNYLPRDPFPLEIFFSWDPMCNTNSWENFLHGTLVPMGNLR